MNRVALEVENLSVEFPSPGARGLFQPPATFRALSDISLSVATGEVLGLIGESGSGKTTLGKAIVGLVQTSQGQIQVDGTALDIQKDRDRHELARRVQMVFQDPFSSLHPRKTVGHTLAEPFRIQKTAGRNDQTTKVNALLERVGLSPTHAARYPQHFSGGQRQRIAIARAIANQPSVLVADEPVSALDVSVQAQILNLLDDLKSQENMAMLFISHDLSVVRHLCQRIAVMYLGRIVEIGPAKELAANPAHPYTAALMSAVPRVKARNKARSKPIVLQGDVPSHAAIPSGCPFHTRCWLYEKKGCPARCRTEVPSLDKVDSARQSACFYSTEVESPDNGA
ncbi:Oligopeptide transport ATP-binding protein OppF [Roseovarius albus]|uniref:Oligopeptide transport ATP-binding protein OppF n=1 Tax=Roseovarius albus TaxID=1247867 RepID=A0A1X7A3N4_9RHOB|nr:oligopeptide/dipeptide ABC transporter ATP-binding protein [Roseovarius albus]SLN69733.1 Oligopeptide transport ATP-binding protein OppF [Roseovarius albus]